MGSDHHMEDAKTLNAADWNAVLSALPGGHILQSWQWGYLKSMVGWEPMPFIWRNTQGEITAAAMVLKRCLSSRFPLNQMNVLYVPKGPIMDWTNLSLCQSVLVDLSGLARKEKSIFIKIDPDIWLGTGEPGTPEEIKNPAGEKTTDLIASMGWTISDEQIQFRNTVMLDLTRSEDELLAAMKQKSRYNLNLAARKEVTVRAGTEADVHLLYLMYAETSLRDGFVIRDEAYYAHVWKTLMSAGMAQPMIAEVGGEPVAALIMFMFADRAYYFYGMSREIHRDKMPNYLLQWDAIKRAKSMGCKIYDFWGAPDEFSEKDSMWGVYRFKRGLGGMVYRGCGAYDLKSRPLIYALYTKILPEVLSVMRRRGKQKTRQEVSP